MKVEVLMEDVSAADRVTESGDMDTINDCCVDI